MKIVAIFLIFILANAALAAEQPLHSAETAVTIAAPAEAGGDAVLMRPQLLARMLYMRKDPFLAGVLSWPMWGVGHMYAGDYTKGSLLVFGDLIYKALLVGLAIKISNKYTDPEEKESVSWREISSFDRTLIMSYALTYLGISLWSFFDAMKTAEAYNRRFDIPQRLHLGMGPDSGGAAFCLGWNIPF